MYFRSTPEKAKRKKGEDKKNLPGDTLIEPRQQLKKSSHVYVSDGGGPNRYAGKIKSIDFAKSTALIYFYKWPSDKNGTWKFDTKYWLVQFDEILGILQDPFVTEIGHKREGYLFRELLGLL